MPNNTLDCITVVGDSLNAINFRLSNMLSTTEDYKILEAERDKVRARYDILVKFLFSDSTKRFIKADSDLADVNKEMQAELKKLENMQKTIDSVTRLVTALDTFITAIFA